MKMTPYPYYSIDSRCQQGRIQGFGKGVWPVAGGGGGCGQLLLSAIDLDAFYGEFFGGGGGPEHQDPHPSLLRGGPGLNSWITQSACPLAFYSRHALHNSQAQHRGWVRTDYRDMRVCHA